MKFLFILLALTNLANAEIINPEGLTLGDYMHDQIVKDDELERLKAIVGYDKLKNKKEYGDTLNVKLQYKSNRDSSKYKARMNCLMSETKTEECDKLFPVPKKIVHINQKIELNKSDKKKLNRKLNHQQKIELLERLMKEASQNNNISSDPINLDA
jgi:hypothetical protein